MIKRSLITTVGRPIDLSYPTNRAIAIVALLVLFGATILQRISGATGVESAIWGANAALAVFLAWALCRELDPDHKLSAFVATGLCLGSLVLWGLPRLLVLFWVILILRVVNRTMGRRAGVLDCVGLLGLGVWLSLRNSWSYGVITACAFFLDAKLPERTPRQLVFGVLAAVGTLSTAFMARNPPWSDGLSLGGTLIALVTSIFFAPVICESHSVTSVGDQTGKPLKALRVQAAQVLALVVMLQSAILGGVQALEALTSLWTAALGAGFYWIYRALRAA